ncbi:MAG: hypothetical protein DWB56_07990 [Candidatus Jettenia sp.]|nr:hypothetical protein [Candidatus Jettenia sp. AMX1]MBC6928886.1 hypothetical protein [Candidatus Jettenia sp.]MDL1938434.1 hypothetical protein [Candidatus Jettenia sp. AMX1]GIL19689.1 MAG: hypothetical protein BroJett041_08030 [Candidatus Jettenia caeni]GJQ45900.1 MAG: hypothetical protein JETCAE04_16540 [Candidatus Jettenia caeni]
MFKLKIKTTRGNSTMQDPRFPDHEYTGPYEHTFDSSEDELYQDPHRAQLFQEIDTCIFCGSPIMGCYISLEAKNVYPIHVSCLLSSATLLVNGIGLLVNWLGKRKKKEE